VRCNSKRGYEVLNWQRVINHIAAKIWIVTIRRGTLARSLARAISAARLSRSCKNSPEHFRKRTPQNQVGAEQRAFKLGFKKITSN
jgi:hypothetical protein